MLQDLHNREILYFVFYFNRVVDLCSIQYILDNTNCYDHINNVFEGFYLRYSNASSVKAFNKMFKIFLLSIPLVYESPW